MTSFFATRRPESSCCNLRNMGDPGLNYNVVFPQPSGSADQKYIILFNCHFDFAMKCKDTDCNIRFAQAVEKRWKGTEEPVVILLGWAGCRDKHLAKYSSMYNDQGCITFRYTAPLRSVFISESFGYRELNTTAHKLLELLYEYEVENHPIFFHIFSNGGFMLYRYIAELLRDHQQFRTLRVVGVVVDSAPGNRNLRGGLRAIMASVGPSTNVVVLYTLLLLFSCMVFLIRCVLYPVTKFIHKSHYDSMLERPSSWPQLYLYSRADRVIQHQDVERMVKAIQEKGLPVESFDFRSPDHVSLFRDFPEEYANRCLEFLHRCLGDMDSTLQKQHSPVPS